MHKLIDIFITPKSSGEDRQRQEMILNIILTISLGFFLISEIVITINAITKGVTYNGVSPLSFGCVLIFVALLLVASRKGFVRIVSFILIGLFSIGATYSGFHWGASLPATILTFILVIQISSILVSTRFGMIMTIVTAIVLILTGMHEYHNPEILKWRFEPINNTDFITYSALLIFISLLSWLSNKQIEKSLMRARSSELELRREKELLEIRVEERTREIKVVQVQRLDELSKVAEFGRLAQGLFHDLMSPLSSVVLHMSTLKNLDAKQIQESSVALDRIVKVSDKMAAYMKSVKYSMCKDSESRICDISEEIEKTISIMGYKARSNNVHIEFQHEPEILWCGNPLKLHQIFSNLISNAIDACAEKPGREERYVIITINKNNNLINISFKDNGIGIESSNMQKIFDPFYTTKPPEHGTGIGLNTVRKIIDELGGTIQVDSTKDIGSVFIMSIPGQ